MKKEWPLWVVMLQKEPQAVASMHEYLELQLRLIEKEAVSRVLDAQAYAVQVGRAEMLRAILNLLNWSKEDHDATRRESEPRVNGRSATH